MNDILLRMSASETRCLQQGILLLDRRGGWMIVGNKQNTSNAKRVNKSQRITVNSTTGVI